MTPNRDHFQFVIATMLQNQTDYNLNYTNAGCFLDALDSYLKEKIEDTAEEAWAEDKIKERLPTHTLEFRQYDGTPPDGRYVISGQRGLDLTFARVWNGKLFRVVENWSTCRPYLFEGDQSLAWWWARLPEEIDISDD